MGVTIFYRGQINMDNSAAPAAKLRQYLVGFGQQPGWEVHDFTGATEGEVLEVVLRPPGDCEPLWFLADADGRLHLPPIGEAPDSAHSWCFVRTQRAPVEIQTRISELLRHVRNRYIPNLQVLDQGLGRETANTDNVDDLTLGSVEEWLLRAAEEELEMDRRNVQ